MFVMTEEEIQENAKARYKCFGIVIPDDLQQQYIHRLFDDLTKTYSVQGNINDNRPLMNVTFCTAFRSYIGQLTTEKIASLIETAEEDFINTMFVMTKEDIQVTAHDQFKCFGIVIPDDLLQQYIHRLFDNLTKSNVSDTDINENRPLMNVAFRTVFRSYISQLTTDKIVSLISTTEDGFISKMFIMTQEDIEENAENRYKCFGIVIPDGLLQQYIHRLFDDLTKTRYVEDNINENRPLMNVTFCTAFRSYIGNLTTKKIASLIQTAEHDFINTMFVMTEEDIKEDSKNRYECFGIVIPVDLLQQYIERLIDDMTKSLWLLNNTNENRLFMNVMFRSAFRAYIRKLHSGKIASLIQTAESDFFNKMFVMTEEDINEYTKDRYECFGIVIPDYLLQLYIHRLLDYLTKSLNVKDFINENRPLMNVTFRSNFRFYIRQLTTEKIGSLIQTAEAEFINLMFVMTEEDINEYAEDRYECVGIVIPNDLLQQYIRRLFDDLTKTFGVEDITEENRPLMNVTFRPAFLSYIRQLDSEIIASLIQTPDKHFFNQMFVMTEKDINENAKDRYECVGIVISDDLLQQYIHRLFDDLTKTQWIVYTTNENRLLMNVTFRTAFRSYIGKLTTETIASLIETAEEDFINQMFVMTKEDINENAKNLYECIGIVIPDDLLQQYIHRLIDDLTKTRSIVYKTNENRLLMNITFRTVFRNYIRQLNIEGITSLILNAEDDFINTMFVMTENEIEENAENRYECYGIVIPDDLLQQYIQRWFDDLTKTNTVEKVTDANRPLLDITFRTAFRTYIQKLDTRQISSIIQTANYDFINKMFVMTEEDIDENAKNRYECFGIVIPDGLLQEYIERLFDNLTKTSEVEKFIDENRSLQNEIFCTDLCKYMRKLNPEKIASLIWGAKDDFLIKMFVMSEEDVKVNSKNHCGCFGIVIPFDLLHQYIERWFECLTKTSELEKFIDKNRPVRNVTFRTSLRTYMKQLDAEQIFTLIQTGSMDFLNTMFVMTVDEIKNNSETRYEYCGILIPDHLLQQYIWRWFEGLTKTSEFKSFIDKNRLLTSVTFRTALCKYRRQLNTEKIFSLICNANKDFLNKMFVMTEKDIKEVEENRHESFVIVIPDDLLQQYLENWFNNLTKTRCVEKFMDNCRPLNHVPFRTALRTYMRQFHTEKISSLVQNGRSDFLNAMFVMTQEEIEEKSENRCEWFGIVIPDDLLQQYISRWFERLTKTSELEKYIDKNRPVRNVTFRTALRTYMKQLDAEQIFTLIQTGSTDFLNTMFVMTVDEIKNNSETRYEYCGIVIPDDLLHQYISRWFKCLTKTSEFEEFLNKNRLLTSVKFRIAFCNYRKQLNTEKIASLICNANKDFLNKMFVMTERDIKEVEENRYESFVIVIPDDLLQKYLEKWFNNLTKTRCVEKFMDNCRPLNHVPFRTALRTYMRQFHTEKISSLVQSGRSDFLNAMFVMTQEEIEEKSENRCEWFGIVIPDDLLQQYISRWFERLTKTSKLEKFIDKNRPVRNVTFRTALRTYMKQLDAEQIFTLIQTGSTDFLNTMFVMTVDEIKNNSETRYEYCGIAVPDDLLQQYISRWFECLTKTSEFEDFLNKNRLLTSITFRIAFCNYRKQLNTEKIVSLICNAHKDFLNKMFVMTEDDIKDVEENRHECFFIVIPDDLLQQYIGKWFNNLTKTRCVKKFMDNCRPLNHVPFRTALRTYMRQFNTEKILSIVQTGGSDFLNTMFVMTEEDIKDDAENEYECFGIVIPDDILQQYIQRWFVLLSLRLKTGCFLAESRPLTNITFCFALRTYMKQLNKDTIDYLIETRSIDFLNRMFVFTEDEIKDNGDNRNEYFGIVISDDLSLLQHYIENWFDCVTVADSMKECMDANRPLMNVTFRTAVQTFIRQLDKEEIVSIIDSAEDDFINKMFVMTQEDIEENAENRYECFGIVIPDDPFLLQQYIARWFNGLKDANSVKECINANRLLMNITFCAALRTYTRQLDAEKIEILIQTCSSDFLNTMFVQTEKYIIKDNAKNRYEFLRIVIPNSLLQAYTKRWIECTKKDEVGDGILIGLL